MRSMNIPYLKALTVQVLLLFVSSCVHLNQSGDEKKQEYLDSNTYRIITLFYPKNNSTLLVLSSEDRKLLEGILNTYVIEFMEAVQTGPKFIEKHFGKVPINIETPRLEVSNFGSTRAFYGHDSGTVVIDMHVLKALMRTAILKHARNSYSNNERHMMEVFPDMLEWEELVIQDFVEDHYSIPEINTRSKIGDHLVYSAYFLGLRDSLSARNTRPLVMAMKREASVYTSFTYYVRIIVGHELAHHVLDHGNSQAQVREGNSYCESHISLEREADELGLAMLFGNTMEDVNKNMFDFFLDAYVEAGFQHVVNGSGCTNSGPEQRMKSLQAYTEASYQSIEKAKQEGITKMVDAIDELCEEFPENVSQYHTEHLSLCNEDGNCEGLRVPKSLCDNREKSRVDGR